MGKQLELLKKALALLKQEGWVKGSYQRDNMFCTVGALEKVFTDEYGPRFRDDDVWLDYRNLLNIMLDEANNLKEGSDSWAVYGSVEGFNDAYKTTFEDVRTVFQRSIARLKTA